MKAYDKYDVVLHYKCSRCGEVYIHDFYYGGPTDHISKIPKTCWVCGYYIDEEFKRRKR